MKKGQTGRAGAKAIVGYQFYFKIMTVYLRYGHDMMISLIAVMIKHNEKYQSANLSLFRVVKLPKSKMKIQTRSFNEPR